MSDDKFYFGILVAAFFFGFLIFTVWQRSQQSVVTAAEIQKAREIVRKLESGG